MNKLILIGNGFDLAHGLPTSYNDFLDDFWANLESNYKKEEYKKLVYINERYYKVLNFEKPTESFKDFEDNLVSYQNEHNNELFPYSNNSLKIKNNHNIVFKFENDFFKTITTKESIDNWVDIENEYYKELKKIIKEVDLQTTRKVEDFLKSKKVKVEKLNLEFKQIKNLLSSYLNEKVLNKFDFNDFSDKNRVSFYKFFKFNYHGEDQEYLDEFSFKEDRDSTYKLLRGIESGSNHERELLFLNFNYTPTIKEHLKRVNSENPKVINIHGDINNMIFGFGDETDNDYQLIENMNDNEYLENFKAFKYSLNSNYDHLFSFIESGKYQISIMGHSCGLSDRVLLNSIFEHKNCRSIKLFYHQKENGEDNYSDIIQNISRHFENKSMMRRKIVNKTLCSPLPQNVRFQKKE